MTIAGLPAQTEAEITTVIDTGDSDDATAGVVRAVHELTQQEQSLATLRATLQVGLEKIERGEMIPVTTERGAQLFASAVAMESWRAAEC